MSYKDIMTMPMKSFWCMANNISRVSAERDLRLLTLHSAVQSSEASEDYRRSLVEDLGVVIKMDGPTIIESVRDDDGVAFLKGLK